MKQIIEFRNCGEIIEMWTENDAPPFNDYVVGEFKRDDEGYYRFHPSATVVMTCKHLREAAKKASFLNSTPNDWMSVRKDLEE